MAKFRAEPVYDSGSGKYLLELYYPEDATTPSAVSDPLYATQADAEHHAVETFKKWLHMLHNSPHMH